MLVTADIGNTNIVLAIFDGEDFVTSFRVYTDIHKTSDEYFVIFNALFREGGVKAESVTSAIISSVVPNLTRSIEKNLRRLFGITPLVISHDVETGLRKETIPSELGSDLLCNLAYAHYRKPDEAVMVIDFGTALTLSAVDSDGSVFGYLFTPLARSYRSPRALPHAVRHLRRGGAPLPSCRLSAEDIASAVDAMEEKPCAVYITSPDYLGGMAETEKIAQITRERGVPLLLDGAHGAYLDVLSAGHNNCQPDLWCASAHKTLGVLTGGAYLHVGGNALSDYEKDAKEALGVFGSSSPSYLVMASLDAANGRIFDGFADSLNFFIDKVENLKRRLSGFGVPVAESDPLRITIAAHEAGYSGYELAAKLREHGCECEFADPDWLVMMLTPENDMRDFERIIAAFADFSPWLPRQALTVPVPGEAVMTPREALLAAREIVPVGEAAGRVTASAAVTCPPAVPIAVMGERITAEQAELMLKYGITSVEVVR